MLQHLLGRRGRGTSLGRRQTIEGLGTDCNDAGRAPRDVPAEIVLGRPQSRSDIERYCGTGPPKVGARLRNPSPLVVEERHNSADAERSAEQVNERLLGDRCFGCCADQDKLAGGAQRAALRRRP